MATLTIKNFHSTEEPVKMKCKDVDTGKMIFEFISKEKFEQKVELELIDDNGRIVESKFIKPE